jgi:hypothetical protein
MSLDWKQPFYIAAELFLWLLGWALVSVIVLVGVAFFFEILRAFRNAITKRNKTVESEESEEFCPVTGLKSVD